MNDEVLARLTPSPARRWFAVLVLGALGFLLVYLALSTRMEAGYKFALSALGLAIIWQARFLYRSTAISLELTKTELRTSAGQMVVAVADVTGVDRGAFAFKPSNGFLVRSAQSQPRAWAPGLWWRAGRSIGVGGVTPAAEGKLMAELLQGLKDGNDLGLD